MNFNRKLSKQSRAGCLLCKPYKAMGNSKGTRHIHKTRSDRKFEDMVNEFINDHHDVLTELAKR